MQMRYAFAVRLVSLRGENDTAGLELPYEVT
jgi:hypothetical protein